MDRNGPAASGRTRGAAFVFHVTATAAIVLVALHVGQGFLIPLTLAGLLFILLVAIIDRIAALRVGGRAVPGWLSHLLGVALLFSGVLAVVAILASQADAVTEAFPRYVERFERVLALVVSAVGEKAAASFEQGIAELDLAAGAEAALGAAGGVLNGLFLVLLYLPFLLVERGPFRGKLALLVPDPDDHARALELFDSISLSLQRYVGIKTFVSLLTGLLTYAVIKPLGVDFAETWALLAFVLNFIPSIGSILGVVMPALVSLVQFDDLTPFLIVVLGCGAAQFVIGNLVEPAITGRTLNLSTLAVILSLTFWGAMWGMAGAFLSVPITVAAMTVCAHFESWRWAAVLLSGDGRLPGQAAESPPDPRAEAVAREVAEAVAEADAAAERRARGN